MQLNNRQLNNSLYKGKDTDEAVLSQVIYFNAYFNTWKPRTELENLSFVVGSELFVFSITFITRVLYHNIGTNSKQAPHKMRKPIAKPFEDERLRLDENRHKVKQDLNQVLLSVYSIAQLHVYGDTDLVNIKRFGEVHECSKVCRFLNHVQFAISRHHDDSQRWINLLDMLQNL